MLVAFPALTLPRKVAISMCMVWSFISTGTPVSMCDSQPNIVQILLWSVNIVHGLCDTQLLGFQPLPWQEKLGYNVSCFNVSRGKLGLQGLQSGSTKQSSTKKGFQGVCFGGIHKFWENTSYCIIEGSLEVKLPTIWTDGKTEVGRVREEKSRREKIREEKERAERRCRCAKR